MSGLRERLRVTFNEDTGMDLTFDEMISIILDDVVALRAFLKDISENNYTQAPFKASLAIEKSTARLSKLGVECE